MPNKFVVFHIQDVSGALRGALLTAESPNGNWTGVTNDCGDCKTWLAPGYYGLTVRWQNLSAFRDVTIGECTNTNEGSGYIEIGLDASAPPPGILQPLIADGAFFKLTDGTRWTAIECTDFQLFQRWLFGQDIAPVLAQRRDVGFNLLRVALSCAQMFELNPASYDPTLQIPKFLALLASYGLRAELVVFLDATIIVPDFNNQRGFFIDVCNAVFAAGGTALVELVNENDQPVNTINVDAFQCPSNVLAAHGSNGSEKLAVRPWWSYETMHFNDASEWQRKTGHNSMEITDGDPEGFIEPSHVPVIANENTRFPDRDDNPFHAYDAAAAAALLCAGSCFHSVHGKSSELWTSIEGVCALNWAMGAASVPLEYQVGRYERLDPGNDLRVYQRVLDDGRAWTVRIRK